jgi:hypothetical protein
MSRNKSAPNPYTHIVWHSSHWHGTLKKDFILFSEVAMVDKNKTLYEEFARFFEMPSREGLRDLLKKNVGELPYCDFKEQWPQYPKLARHLLGLSNSGGGCVIIGMAEREDKTFEPKGVEILVGKAVIIDGVKKFLPNSLLTNFQVLNFGFDAAEYPAIVGKKFQVLFVEDDPKHFPFVSMNEGDGIRKNSIYVRRGTSTEEATYEELQRIINRRLETDYSSQREMNLETHLEQLKVLFRQINKYHETGRNLLDLFFMGSALSQAFSEINKKLQSGLTPNPNYPKEDFEAFIVRMIEKKKKRIEIELDVVKRD